MEIPFTLYHLEFCSYCVKVRRAAERMGIPLQLVDVAKHKSARAFLREHLGRSTVPVLSIDQNGETELLPESEDIIRRLEQLSGHRQVATR